MSGETSVLWVVTVKVKDNPILEYFKDCKRPWYEKEGNIDWIKIKYKKGDLWCEKSFRAELVDTVEHVPMTGD